MCYGAIIQGGGGGNVVSAAHPYASHLVLLIELHKHLFKQESCKLGTLGLGQV